MLVQPLHDRVLVRRTAPAETTPSGLILPEVTRWRGDRGTVLAVGPGKKTDKGIRRQLLVQPGDTVLLPEYAGVEVRIDGELLALLTEDEIVAILPPDACPAA